MVYHQNLFQSEKQELKPFVGINILVQPGRCDGKAPRGEHEWYRNWFVFILNSSPKILNSPKKLQSTTRFPFPIIPITHLDTTPDGLRFGHLQDTILLLSELQTNQFTTQLIQRKIASIANEHFQLRIILTLINIQILKINDPSQQLVEAGRTQSTLLSDNLTILLMASKQQAVMITS